MYHKPTLGTVVGPTDSYHWGQIFLTPEAYGVIEIYDADGSARDDGVKLLAALAEYSTAIPNTLEDIEMGLKKIITQKSVSLLFLVPKGEVVSIILLGEGSVYIKRNDQCSCLLEKHGAVVGKLQPNDTLLLLSKSFSKALTKEQFVRVFDHLNPIEIAEKLTLLLHKAESGLGSAGLVFQALDEKSSYGVVESRDEGVSIVSHKKITLRHIRPEKFRDVWKNKRLLMMVISVLCIGLFGISIIVGFQKQQKSRQQTVAGEVIKEGRFIYEEGVALLDLNPLKGRQRLEQAEKMVAPLVEAVAKDSKEGSQIRELYENIHIHLQQAMNIVRGEPLLFYDSELLKKGANISAMSLYDQTLALLDKFSGSIFTVSLNTKSGQVIAGGSGFKSIDLIAMHGANVYLFDPQGIRRVDIQSLKTTQNIISKSEEWQNILAMTAFGGNLYLLDGGPSRIWKYVQGETQFGSISEYLNPDSLPNFSTATSMAIDGSIWIGQSDGTIHKFTQGREDTFLVKGVEPEFGSNISLFTSDTVDNLYVLDSSNKRIVVIQKTGEYLSQYIWESDLKPTQFVVSEVDRKILLLVAGKVYAIELK